MLDKNKKEVVSDFFLDGAKIIFASLVVGVFVPGVPGDIPWVTFAVGVIVTLVFLFFAVKLAKME